MKSHHGRMAESISCKAKGSETYFWIMSLALLELNSQMSSLHGLPPNTTTVFQTMDGVI
jgi:hypothetical protein